MRNDISSTNTLYLGIASKPQNLGVALTTQTTGSFRSFIVELQICNSLINHRRNSALGHFLIIYVVIMTIHKNIIFVVFLCPTSCIAGFRKYQRVSKEQFCTLL